MAASKIAMYAGLGRPRGMGGRRHRRRGHRSTSHLGAQKSRMKKCAPKCKGGTRGHYLSCMKVCLKRK